MHYLLMKDKIITFRINDFISSEISLYSNTAKSTSNTNTV